jgi:hypothetical protein
MTFYVWDSVNDTNQEPFAAYMFEVESHGFRKIYGQCRDEFLEGVKTWKCA